MNTRTDKILGASLALAAFSFITPSHVQAQTCVTPPTCDKLGYSMSVSDCDGYKYIRCPLDIDNDSAVYCSKPCSCPDGSSPYNSCTVFSEKITGGCGNTCYKCWDGKYHGSGKIVCHYENGVFITASSTSVRVECRNANNIVVSSAMFGYQEKNPPVICPATGKVDVGKNLSISGFCNSSGGYSTPIYKSNI